MATMNAPTKLTQMNTPTKPAQIRLARGSSGYWRVTIDNPPINVMGPEMVKQFQEVIGALEADERTCGRSNIQNQRASQPNKKRLVSGESLVAVIFGSPN
jgi:hypothetical protein